MKRHLVRAVIAAQLVVLVLVPGAGCPFADPGSAWIEEASQASARADAASARGDREAARRELRPIVEGEAPESIAPADRRIVVQDVVFRLASLDLSDGRAESALRWAEQGLALGRDEDVFTANLLVVRGRAREALGRDREAAEDFYRALHINEVLLQHALGDDG